MIFERLSSGPTIPELMQAELQDWLARPHLAGSLVAWHRLAERSRLQTCLLGAELVLGSARLLLALRLIEPDSAAGAIAIATRLARTGMRRWRRAGTLC